MINIVKQEITMEESLKNNKNMKELETLQQ